MAKKKEELKAKVWYNRGNPECGPDDGKAFDSESFVLSVWSPEDNCWCTDTIAPLRNCAEYPNAKEREFIHYEFMMKIFQYLQLGAKVYFCKAGEE